MRAKILVIEDEISIVELLKYNLSKAGYDVDHCLDGETALDKIFSTTKYDLILIDWMLPELSGIEKSAEGLEKINPPKMFR